VVRAKDGDRETVQLGDERLTFTFDEKAARRAVEFFPRYLKHFKGPRHLIGKPFDLAPWQFDLIWNVFGWKRRDGTRRYRVVFVGIPRKNGKSLFAAGLALLLLVADDEPGAEIYGAASDREQARLIWDYAKQMVLRNEELRALLEVFDSSKRITFRDPYTYGPGFYEAIPADAAGALGFNASGIIVDELLTQPNRKLVDALTTSVGARSQPLTIYFSTAGFDKGTICGEEWDRAQAILDGRTVDPFYYAVIFQAGEKDDAFSAKTWEKANPGWDYMGPQFREFLKAEARKAKTVPAFLNPFKMYHLDLWQRQSIRWMPMDAWDRCGQLLDDLKGRDCWMGVSVWDSAKMAAAVLVFAPPGGDEQDEGTYDVLPFYWIPRDAVDREKDMTDSYLSWEANTFLTVQPTKALDMGAMRRDLLALLGKYRVKGFSGDRLAMFEFAQEIEEAGIPVTAAQHTTTSMSAPTKDMLRLVMSGRLRHGGHPVLSWNADNVVVISDTSGEIRPSRTKSVKSIEGICALVMAVGQAITGRKPEEASDFGFAVIA